eukprot:COSAG01_NODE_8082_length_2927_cov_5.885472_6_plen_216_part_01
MVGKYRVRPVSSATLAAFEQKAQLAEVGASSAKGRAAAAAAAAAIGARRSFVTTIAAAHHVAGLGARGASAAGGRGGVEVVGRPEWAWPDHHANPLQEIGSEFPVDPFEAAADGEADLDGDGDADAEDKSLYGMLGPFTEAEVRRLDAAVQLRGQHDWVGVSELVNGNGGGEGGGGGAEGGGGACGAATTSRGRAPASAAARAGGGGGGRAAAGRA